MTGLGASSAGTGADLSIGPALMKLRRDNALSLADAPYDPAEDEPHIARAPKPRPEPSADEPEGPHS